jgi:hypothetical protein
MLPALLHLPLRRAKGLHEIHAHTDIHKRTLGRRGRKFYFWLYSKQCCMCYSGELRACTRKMHTLGTRGRKYYFWSCSIPALLQVPLRRTKRSILAILWSQPKYTHRSTGL